MIAALTEDSRNDAKGSAGDKHETALSMMQIEQEKLNFKLSEFLAQKQILDKAAAAFPTGKIALGSLVEMGGMFFFLSAALPKTTIDGKTIIALSPASPLGANLMGKESGFSFSVNGKEFSVGKIL